MRASSPWRATRGEPQPAQRAARFGTSARQSRQKLAIGVAPGNRSRIIAGSLLIWPATGAVEDAEDMDGVADDAVRQDVRRTGYDKLACLCDSPRASGVRQSGKLPLGTVHDAGDHCVGGTFTVLRDIRAERAKVRQRRS